MQSKKSFEESIQEQIKEHEQNPSVLLNTVEFLEALSMNIEKPQKEQKPISVQVPNKPLDKEEKNKIIEKLRLKFELLKQSRKGKNQDRER